MIDPIQEHGLFSLEYNVKYKNLSLVTWSKPFENTPWGYYASYKIGAEWIDDEEPLIVTTKDKMENIDFLGMFTKCFCSNLAIESFSKIYSLDFDKPTINAPCLKNVVSPLIVFHFIGVVSRIKNLKRGYVHHAGNLKKVKGHVNILKNERLNISSKRYDRIYCDYDEYSVDIPENRLLKKALLFSMQLLQYMGETQQSYNKITLLTRKSLSLFENVSDHVEIRDVGHIKGHKLFKEYSEAIRLAKLVLKHFDYSISNVTLNEDNIMPFTLDMSLLYEHYVYGLLYETYGNKISYQDKGKTGYPDFLYSSKSFKAILDTKYIPKYESQTLDTYVIRQLCGYSRDIPILKKLGYEDVTEESSAPTVPCVIIYPEEGNDFDNPFKNKKLKDLCAVNVPNVSRFYKIPVKLPTINT